MSLFGGLSGGTGGGNLFGGKGSSASAL